MKSSDRQDGANREVLGALIVERLELEEEWCPHDGFSYLAGRIKSPKSFESAFKRVLAAGCRWDVLLTCLARTLTYDLEEVQQQPRMPRDSAEGEPPPIPMQNSKRNRLPKEPEASFESRPTYRPKIMPPTADEREGVRANFEATSSLLKKYDTLLLELAMYLPFESSGLGPDLTPIDALIVMPKLLKWAESLLTDQVIGNARTVKSIGPLVPCVYIELLASRHPNPSARPVLPWLKFIAEILNEIKGENMQPSRSVLRMEESEPPIRSASQLAQALRRFKREYPDVHDQLCRKLTGLHDLPRPEANNWHQAYVRDIAGPRPRKS
jgi:hypothetical protein